MEFDESKVRTEWSDELEGKKGWFGDRIHDKDEDCLRNYVEMKDENYYWICHKGNKEYPFKSEVNILWKYFYPDDEEEKEMEFDKKNLFIAGYNENLLHTGDAGYIGDSVSDCVSKLTGCCAQHVLTGCLESGFITDADTYPHQFFYRTKCAPEKHYIPWTKENFPLNVLDIVNDSESTTFISSIKNDKSAVWIGCASCAISLRELFDNYTMPDGSPCGQEIE